MLNLMFVKAIRKHSKVKDSHPNEKANQSSERQWQIGKWSNATDNLIHADDISFGIWNQLFIKCHWLGKKSERPVAKLFLSDSSVALFQ